MFSNRNFSRKKGFARRYVERLAFPKKSPTYLAALPSDVRKAFGFPLICPPKTARLSLASYLEALLERQAFPHIGRQSRERINKIQKLP